MGRNEAKIKGRFIKVDYGQQENYFCRKSSNIYL